MLIIYFRNLFNIYEVRIVIIEIEIKSFYGERYLKKDVTIKIPYSFRKI